MRSAKKVPLPPHQEIWYIEYCAEYGRTAWVRRGWKQMFPILDKPQWYARVVLAESIPIDKYAAYVRIDWIEGFRGDYHNWDKKKIYRCYISRDLSEDPVFTIQYRKTHLQPYPAIYSVLVKQIFRKLYYIFNLICAVNIGSFIFNWQIFIDSFRVVGKTNKMTCANINK